MGEKASATSLIDLCSTKPRLSHRSDLCATLHSDTPGFEQLNETAKPGMLSSVALPHRNTVDSVPPS